MNLLERILIIDDDKVLCSLLSTYLKTEGMEIDFVHDLKEGQAKVLNGKYSLIILDVIFPGGQNGFDLLQKIRTKDNTPVVMLTSRSYEVDRIIGLEMSADDYISKPFNPRELLARIHAILRRAYPQDQEEMNKNSDKYKLDDIELDYCSRTMLRSGISVKITAIEFNILDKLMRNAGELVTRDELATDFLGHPLSPYDRSIDVHISRLRKKLGSQNDGTQRIKSIRGAGYIYVCSMMKV